MWFVDCGYHLGSELIYSQLQNESYQQNHHHLYSIPSTYYSSQNQNHSPLIMSFNFNKRSLVKTLFSSNKSCGCIKIKPSNVLQPSQKPKISFCQNTNPNSITSSTTSHDANTDDKDFTSTTILNDNGNNNNNNYRILKPGTKLIDSVAVEKESKEPYEDFRNSILQMILEREIYSENDLQELLECFLQLNAKCHHHVIVEAFMETCEGIFPKKLCGDGRRVKDMWRHWSHTWELMLHEKFEVWNWCNAFSFWRKIEILFNVIVSYLFNWYMEIYNGLILIWIICIHYYIKN